jgi:DNA replication protein DnaC
MKMCAGKIITTEETMNCTPTVCLNKKHLTDKISRRIFMLNEETHQKLVLMRLLGFAGAFDDYLQSTDGNNLTFEERFGLMVDREWTDRQQKKLTRRLLNANLREAACVEDINYRHPRSLDRSVMQRLITCNWVAKCENILITGPSGIGKTWLACSLANKACREGYTAIFTRAPRLWQNLLIARADGSYVKELNKLAKANVLILDDFALEPLGDNERHDMLEILEDRRGIRSTIVTSQYLPKLWHERIGDPTIADAIMERLVHCAHRIELKGPSILRSEKASGNTEEHLVCTEEKTGEQQSGRITNEAISKKNLTSTNNNKTTKHAKN